MNFILGVVAFTFVLTGCSSNAINDSLNLSENDKTQLNSRGSIEDSIVALTVDTTTTIYKSMQASRSNKMRKAASYEMGNQSALDVLFDLRGLPVNIVVKENTNGSRFLTAMRKKKTFLWNTSYTSLPACFAQKQNDGNTSSQTFYLNYILVWRSLAALSSAKSPDFVVVEARLLPCISKIKYRKQELSI